MIPSERGQGAADAGRQTAQAGAGRLDARALSQGYRLAPIAPPSAESTARARQGRARYELELAWDGHRVLVSKAGNDVRLVSADYREWSETFPSITTALRRLAARDLVLDGWICGLDQRGRPSFEVLRGAARDRAGPVILALWDVLHEDGEDLRPRPLAERRARLAKLLEGSSRPLASSEAVAGELDDVLAGVRGLGVPGLVARPCDGVYPPPGDDPWIAVPAGDAALAWGKSLSPPPTVTNATKVLFPRDGFTKRRVVDYYAAIAPVLVPHLVDRPVVCQRWPDGINEFTWYQHRVPPRAPDYLRAVWIEDNRRIVIENENALLWMVNQACLTFHSWASRVASLSEPDWVLFDLDPADGTPWERTIEVALALRRLLELLELPSVSKTSGQKGLHVLVPIAPGHTVDQAHRFARAGAQMLARLLPHAVTLETERERRGGRVYVDHLQSFVGKSLVCAYSLRAADGGPVSTPLDWSEVTPSLDPRSFTLDTVLRRIEARGDLAAPLLAGTARLAAATSGLEAQLR